MIMIAVFENRTQSLLFSRNLKQLGATCKLVNTPRSISTSCGISVEFDKLDVRKALYVLKAGRYSTFKGIYQTILTSAGTQYRKMA